eukprot:CAMPEP_0197543346 /NCGR_PEP_ID=MMETSP1318-20131121/68190_1 /TAXON_ID=552666 /ORGANISM="Partenskyella glossopodia, Strain RCC365" /LENGTH=366 /DNA_ID=CAMNT_0043102675 /DNA_START=154 /DNA_END=1254 /DNA_ORIENTATION=-
MTDEEYLAQKDQLEKFQLTLKKMATEAGNKKCADCRESGPRYIDATWGVYLCLLCSGAHSKTLGSTIVTVDTTEVDEQWIDTLEQRGNDKVNDNLEYKLETRDKRKMSWSITNRAKFATRKYINGEWIKPGSTIDLKDPAKVSQSASSPSAGDPFDDSTAMKKKKKKKDKKKKKEKKRQMAEQAPQQEAAPQASAKPEESNGLSDLFGLLGTNDKPAGATATATAKNNGVGGAAPAPLADEKGATNDIMAMFDTPSQQPAPQGNGAFAGSYSAGSSYGTGSQPQRNSNPFLQQRGVGGGVAGNPFAQGGGAYPAQPGYGGYPQQPQRVSWQQQQQQQAYQQQMRMQQQQAQQQQAQKGDDLLNFFS